MAKIKVLAKRPETDWYVTYLSNSLGNMQAFVGGYIETVAIAEDAVIVCNEEGRIKGLDFNCTVADVEFYGDIFVCGIKGADFADVPVTLKDWKEVVG